jgi:hypothetical protein
MDRFERLLGRLDRRLVYLGLFVFTLVPLVLQWDLPTPGSKPVRDLYEVIETLPKEKIVFIGIEWDAGTQPESRPQMLAMARHMIRRGIRFAMLSVGYPQSPQLSHDVVEEAVRLEKAEDRFQYGRDWVNLGYKELTRPWLLAFVQDPRNQIKADWKQRPLSETFLAQLSGFGRERDIPVFIDVTGQRTIEEWRPLLYPRGVKVGLACTAVMAPEQYPFLANGQLVGMLTGLKGAAEYEQLLKYTGSASRNMAGQSFAHLYIILLLVLGNLSILTGMLRGRARRGIR